MKISEVPNKKQMKEYKTYLERVSKKFRLTSKDLGNLYDLFYMIDDATFSTIKLNKMEKWFREFHKKIEKIVIPELYKKKSKVEVRKK
ncbi:hypothetical protein LCGC14_3104510 [marine sediment metagenome]|uniref:Uncharacterized protein n=1 Tax=marine sediment metagenome TaxID=412755 RepID=A0A0F8W779_9ZZZZ